MTSTPRRRRPALLALCASALVATAALGPVGNATAGPPSASHHAGNPGHHHGHPGRPGHPGHAASPARTATVMTRNLYLGAALDPVLVALASGDSGAIVTAATQTWAAVQATRPPERMAAIADEIVRARPAVVGLQEVTTWTTFAYDPATGATSDPVVAYDFLELLLAELDARGVHYGEVSGATAHNFSSPPIPILADQPYPTRAVQLADRDVILARRDVRTANATSGTFTNIISFPFAGSTLPVARGWGSVDVRTRRASFRFVNSHLEAFGIPGVDAEQLRVAQVGELLAAHEALAAGSGRLPMVYVGDYNSAAPDAPAYVRLVSAVGRDVWTRYLRRDSGETCCFDATLQDPTDPLTSRIDLVLHSRGVKAPRARIVGDEPRDMTASGLWPSDHAGVVAKLVFPLRGRHSSH